jgi:uncharacterized protein YqgC (DUF456 family)
MTAIFWVFAGLMMAIGVAGTILPAIPGATMVFGGIALAAWADGFTRIPVWVVIVTGLLAALTWVIDFMAAAAGAKRAGASGWAVVGAAVGTAAGIFTGFVGLIFLPLVGAALGEFAAKRDLIRAGKVGIATWLGLLIGTAAKVAIVFAMLGLFAVALLF